MSDLFPGSGITKKPSKRRKAKARRSRSIDYSVDTRPALPSGQYYVFPPYLNKKSYGYAVMMLYRILALLKLCPDNPRPDYDSTIAQLVGHLQRRIGFFKGKDVDENFGPGTRQQLKVRTAIDAHMLTSHTPHRTYWVAPDGKRRVWPPRQTPHKQ